MIYRYIPNCLTILRFILIAPLLYFLYTENYLSAFILFVFAGLTDAIDGFLARQFHWGSELGAMLDPLADKLLLIAMFVSLTLLGFIPLWLLIIVIARDVIIFSGAVIYHFIAGKYKMAPSNVSKVNTFLQILLVTLILSQLGFYPLEQTWIDCTMLLVLLSSLWSLWDYVWVWGKRAYNTRRGK